MATDSTNSFDSCASLFWITEVEESVLKLSISLTQTNDQKDNYQGDDQQDHQKYTLSHRYGAVNFIFQLSTVARSVNWFGSG